MTHLKYFEISHILRSENAQTDALSRPATSAYDTLGRIFVESLKQSSIDRAEEVLQLVAESSWMDPIVQYLTDGTSPEDPAEAKRLRWAASQYIMMDGRLYKRSFSLSLRDAWDRLMRSTRLEKCMKGSAEITWGASPWPTRFCDKVTIGQP